MLAQSAELRFSIGDRVLWRARRNLVTCGWSLGDILRSQPKMLPILPEDADGYRLQSVPAADLQSMMGALPGLITSAPQHYPRRYINMADSYDTYMARFSSKTRSTLGRKARKVAEVSGGTLDVRSFHKPGDVGEFFSAVAPLAAKTYQARLLDAALPVSDAFQKETLTLAADGNLRAFVLFIDGEVVAYLYLPVVEDFLVYAYLGYHPAYAHLSPGTVLQLEALKSLYAEQRFRFFDFTEGDGAHKALFSTHYVDCATVFLLKVNARNRVLLTSQQVFNAGIAQAGGLAQQLGAKAALKRLLRR